MVTEQPKDQDPIALLSPDEVQALSHQDHLMLTQDHWERIVASCQRAYREAQNQTNLAMLLTAVMGRAGKCFIPRDAALPNGARLVVRQRPEGLIVMVQVPVKPIEIARESPNGH